MDHNAAGVCEAARTGLERNKCGMSIKLKVNEMNEIIKGTELFQEGDQVEYICVVPKGGWRYTTRAAALYLETVVFLGYKIFIWDIIWVPVWQLTIWYYMLFPRRAVQRSREFCPSTKIIAGFLCIRL